MSKQPYGVLIIHGFTANLNNVRDLAPPLEALGLPLRMPLLHGHGQDSPEALRGVTWRDWLASADTALQDLLTEAEQVIVIGHSLGGLLTLNLAADHPEQIDGIVLAAAALQLASPLAPGKPLAFLRPLIRLLFKRWALQAQYSDPAQIARDTNYRWAPTDSIMSLLEFSDVTRRRLGEVHTPALILQSTKDSTVDPVSADLIYAGINTPDKCIVWFEKTDHEMFWDNERQAVIDVIVDYVRARAGSASTSQALA